MWAVRAIKLIISPVHTRERRLNISQATLFLYVFSIANIRVIICHLMFNFSCRLCSGCLIRVLNKLPRPCRHFRPLPLLVSASQQPYSGKRVIPTGKKKGAAMRVQGRASLLCPPWISPVAVWETGCRCGLHRVLLGFVFHSRGPDILHLSLTWHLCGALLSSIRVNQLNTESLNSVNGNPASFSQLQLNPDSVPWTLWCHRAPLLFQLLCAGGWIFMNVQKAHMHHSDFHPCHQAMQMKPSSCSPSLSSINDAGKMFPVLLKMSLIRTQLLQILMELGWKNVNFPSVESRGFMTTKMSV